MATERAELEAQADRIRLDQNASEEVMRRRYRSRLSSVYEPQNLFNTPGAGAGNQPTLNQAGGAGSRSAGSAAHDGPTSPEQRCTINAARALLQPIGQHCGCRFTSCGPPNRRRVTSCSGSASGQGSPSDSTESTSSVFTQP